ncbi:MAG TPA: DUF3592 domain-containing protein, partial [Verrucomicrobiae bacterium]
IASTWFQPTGARILRSEVTRHHDSEGGTTHGVKVEYAYSVNGTNYTGTRYTFDGESSSDSRWAYEAVAAFPAGAERVCFYDPRNPSRAVLAPGLHGSDITHLMFITPFNIVAGFFIVYPIWMWRERRRPTLVEPRFSDPLHGREGYALNQVSPLLSFFVLFLFTSFVGIFAVVFTGGFHPTMTKVVTVWGAGFAIAIGTTVYLQMKTRSGRYDLVFDNSARTITVPAVQKRKVVETIPMAEVQKFDVEKVESGTGDDHKVTWQLKMVADGGREVLLQENYFEPQAKRLAQTLNARLNP